MPSQVCVSEQREVIMASSWLKSDIQNQARRVGPVALKRVFENQQPDGP